LFFGYGGVLDTFTHTSNSFFIESQLLNVSVIKRISCDSSMAIKF